MSTGLPTKQNLLWYRPIWLLVGLINLVVFRFSATGTKGIPKEGAFLLLPNHTGTFDPFWAGWFVVRPCWYMATQQLFRIPVLGRFLATLGAFPKVKFVKDRGSMARLSELYEAGEVVTVFPEGERSWDGRNTPALPGIGRLIKRLDGRVVFCRILTGHLVSPRWADYPRYVPLKMEYSEVMTWPQEATPEEITAEVNRQLKIDPELQVDAFTFGWRLAWGLNTYLWACPVCFTPNSLVVHPKSGNAAQCTQCGCAWRLDTSNQMHPMEGEAPELTVFSAYDRMRAHFGEPPVIDAQRYEAEGILLTDDQVSLGRILKGGGTKPEPMGHGRLELCPEGLRFAPQGQEPDWTLDMAEIKAISMEFGNKLQVRTAGAVFQIDPKITTRIQWADFLRPWWARFKEEAGVQG